jgi:hypothetical protein
MAGYTKEQTIKGVKSIDNWFAHNPRKTWTDLLSPENFSGLPKTGFKANELRYDPKFVEIYKDIGFAPKYQYQLMQLIVHLKPEVLKYAEKAAENLNYMVSLLKQENPDWSINKIAKKI